jgi:adenosylcobinamide kinase/adenosylcobinamide-phosphate guanylyltransferase
MAALILVLGGVRSGKSRVAEQLALASPPVTYLATARPGDEEMMERIGRHRERRAALSPPWHTVEEPWDVVEVIESVPGGCVLLECLTLWLTNLLLGVPGRDALGDDEIRERVRRLALVGANAAARLIVVSNEVGCGLMPPNALARRFGDLLGEVNQLLAATASEVYACWAGIPLRLR